MQHSVEPWLRGTHGEMDATRRAVLHALELAREDVERWCGPLSEDEVALRVHDLPSVSFQLQHIARSLDRLMTYAEGGMLSGDQMEGLRREGEASAAPLQECVAGIEKAKARLAVFSPNDLNEARAVGRAALPTTVGGLLIHIAEHTQRHVGQAITTAKVVMALRAAEAS